MIKNCLPFNIAWHCYDGLYGSNCLELPIFLNGVQHKRWWQSWQHDWLGIKTGLHVTVLFNYVICVNHAASDGDRICSTSAWNASLLLSITRFYLFMSRKGTGIISIVTGVYPRYMPQALTFNIQFSIIRAVSRLYCWSVDDSLLLVISFW